MPTACGKAGTAGNQLYPASRNIEAPRGADDELWPFWDRKIKKIGNPSFARLNAQTVADGLQFVLSATKLPLTNEPGAGF